MQVYSVKGIQASDWKPTTWAKLGRREEHLEQIVADNPLVLGLDPYVTGLGSDHVTFRQAVLQSPTGRTLRPDVVILTSTGHLLLVEVKLEDNGELRNRSVIAQIVDYAAAVANLSEDELLNWLGADAGETWTDFVRRHFPDAHSVEQLAAALLSRVRRADIHLAVVCDIAPDGLLDTMRLISSQAALGEFQLHLIQLTPYENHAEPGHVLMIPTEVARTEIVTRTSVVVRMDDRQKIELDVSVSSPDETAEAVKSSKAVARPVFNAVVDSYNLRAADDLYAVGRTVAYRIIHVPGWPWHVHYEFLDQANGPDTVGVDLHIEAGGFEGVAAVLRDFSSSLAQRFEGIEWIPKSPGRGQLRVSCDVHDPGAAADAMVSFIAATRGEVQRAIGETETS